jgi:hypothetical protein
MSLYGHRQLTLFFFPLLETSKNGFVFKGKRYQWHEVARVEIWQEWWPPFGKVIVEYVSHARISLKDGSKIKINGRAFEKKNEPLDKGYLSAFDEIIDLFEKQTKVTASRR